MADSPTPPVEPTGEPKPETQTPAKSQETDGDPKAKPATEVVDVFDAELARRTVQALRDDLKKVKLDAKELEALRAEKKRREEEQMSESERMTAKISELEKREADLLRREVAAETGIPSILADRLQGATKEELLADAAKLLELLPKSKQTPPSLPPTNPADGAVPVNLRTLKAKRDGSISSPFEISRAKELGGGVHLPEE